MLFNLVMLRIIRIRNQIFIGLLRTALYIHKTYCNLGRILILFELNDIRVLTCPDQHLIVQWIARLFCRCTLAGKLCIRTGRQMIISIERTCGVFFITEQDSSIQRFRSLISSRLVCVPDIRIRYCVNFRTCCSRCSILVIRFQLPYGIAIRILLIFLNCNLHIHQIWLDAV